jgi:hypothetical protein
VNVNPSTVLASHSITLPAAPIDGDEVYFSFGGTIANGAAVVTTLSIAANAGQTLRQSLTPTTAVGGDVIAYEFNSALSAWFRVK